LEQFMSQAEQAFRDGDLAAARRLSQEQIRKDPTAIGPRTFLVQLLSLLGEWERARQQLSVLAEFDKESMPLVFTYGPALAAELIRTRVFAGAEKPVVFGQPAPWTALLVEALAYDGTRPEVAADLRAAAFDQAPETAGRSGDRAFAWIADADDRLGPVLETVINGQYMWVPFHQVRSIRVEPPQEPFDLVWAIARFTWSNGGDAVGLIPARYPGTESISAGDGEGDHQLRLSRLTDWRSESGVERPYGQRMLITSDCEYPILDLRVLELNSSDAAATGEPDRTAIDG
jgi:type VI secretion system protein ImpE